MKLKRFSMQSSPYTIVRIAVMRTKLFTASHYHQFMHLSLIEMLQRLQESDYKDEISAYALSAGSLTRLDDVLGKNMVRTMEKLRRISDENTQRILEVYAMRSDFENLKTLLRGMRANIPAERLKRHILPIGVLPETAWDDLMRHTLSVQDLCDQMRGSPFDHIKEAGEMLARKIDEMKNTQIDKMKDVQMEGKEKSEEEGAKKEEMAPGEAGKDEQKEIGRGKRRAEASLQEIPLASWENLLEKQYYDFLSRFVKRYGGSSVGFDEFFTEEIDIRNITTLFKLMNEQVAPAQIRGYLFRNERQDSIPQSIWDEALAKKAIPDLFKVFMKTKYRPAMDIAAKYHAQTGSLTRLETELEKQLLQYSTQLLHRHPLSVDVILGYLLSKSIEQKNLSMLIRGKMMGLPAESMEAFLITIPQQTRVMT